MIIKSYELNKVNLKKNSIYLLYGENEGLKHKVINDTFKEFLKNIYKYDEKEILDNKENFFNNIFSKSFFETKKIIIISRTSSIIFTILSLLLKIIITFFVSKNDFDKILLKKFSLLFKISFSSYL